MLKYGDYTLFDENNFFQNDLKTIIYKEFKNYIKDKDINKQRKKFIEKMTFLNFKEVINNSQFFYFPYKKSLIKILRKKIANEKYNKINNINEIHQIYNQNKEENNSNDNLVRIISKTSITTNQDSSCEEGSIPLNNEKSQIAIQNKNTINKKDSSSTNNFKDSNFIHYNYNPDDVFKKKFHSYYNKGIAEYCFITHSNVKILNNLMKQKLEIIKKIIETNLKDFFYITFGYYGSFFTDVSIEGSDLDMCIYFKPKNKNINCDFGNKLLELLKNLKPLIYKINDYTKSLIPVINLEIDITEEIKKTPLNNNYQYIDYEDLTKIKIDITYNENKEFLENCEQNVKYVKNEIKNYPQIKPVLLLLKRYFKKIGMNKVFYGGISSFSLFLLVLNVIKSEQRFVKNNIEESELLFLVLKKFSTFDFDSKGIGIDNYDYQLETSNQEKKIYILNPLNGLNVSNGKCKAEKLRCIFSYAFNLISSELNYFKNIFDNGYSPFNINPINSIVALLNTRFNLIANSLHY